MSCILAVDGGGTRTRAGLYTPEGELLAETEVEATNPAALGYVGPAISTLTDALKDLAEGTGREVSVVAAGIAGAGRLDYAEEMAGRLRFLLGLDKALITSDIHMLYFANCSAEKPVLVVAGTGSSVLVQRPDGEAIQGGGYGPLLGDPGSAYQVAIEAIRLAEDEPELGAALVKEAGLESHDELVESVQHALFTGKIAGLARAVGDLADAGNASAKSCIERQARELANLTIKTIRKASLIGQAEESGIGIQVSGGMFTGCPQYRAVFEETIRETIARASISDVSLSGHRAALELALASELPDFVRISSGPTQDALPLTERSHEEGTMLDKWPSETITKLMSGSETQTIQAVMSTEKNIARAIDAAAESLKADGRIIYAGAGTSGRLGVLDASECPPTFGVSPDRVVALIAGGEEALRYGIEGAEDDMDAAVRDFDGIKPAVSEKDFVVGITASGTTPYVHAILDRAKQVGATTGLLCCNPVTLDKADIVISLDTGPEVLPGSTRLKAGTATKMVLNQISTGAMALAGYVFEGRMVGVPPANAKLRKRCIRIVAELTDRNIEDAEKLLDASGGSVRIAIVMARKNLDARTAGERLMVARGNLRTVLESD